MQSLTDLETWIFDWLIKFAWETLFYFTGNKIVIGKHHRSSHLSHKLCLIHCFWLVISKGKQSLRTWNFTGWRTTKPHQTLPIWSWVYVERSGSKTFSFWNMSFYVNPAKFSQKFLNDLQLLVFFSNLINLAILFWVKCYYIIFHKKSTKHSIKLLKFSQDTFWRTSLKFFIQSLNVHK